MANQSVGLPEELQEQIGRIALKSLNKHLEEAEEKAWDSLSRYKFQMFGYWAAIWIHLNKIGGFHKPNPFADLVHIAKEKKAS